MINRVKVVLLLAAASLSAAGAAYTSRDYAQQGLIAQWDAIDNVGTGTHDPTVTVWKDLVGDYDLTLTNSAAWKNGDRLVVDGCSAFGDRMMEAYKTIEVVFRLPTNATGRTLFTSGNSTTRQLVVFDKNSDIAPNAYTKGYFSGALDEDHLYVEFHPDNALRSIAGTFSDPTATATAVYGDGAQRTGKTLRNPWANSGGFAVIGAMNKSNSFPWSGEVSAIRIYSRELSASEIAANHAIDLVRFGDQTPASSDYVQEGLVAQWDGIDNAGTGVHNPSASVWRDLVGNYDLTLTGSASWGSEGRSLVVSGPSAVGASAGPSYKTIEVVYKRTDPNGRILFNSGVAFVDAPTVSSRSVIFNNVNSGAKTRVYFSGGSVDTKAFDQPHYNSEINFLAARYDDADTVTDVFKNADRCDNVDYHNSWNTGDGVLMIGGRSVSETNFKWYGEVYAIRLYGRRLTKAELARNHRIDCRRFLTSSSYIQEDLVAHWDGKDNAGRGVHNPSAATWSNLVSGGIDMTVGTGLWTDSSLMSMGGNTASTLAATGTTALAYKTLECVFSNAKTGSGAYVFSGGKSGNVNRILLLHNGNVRWEDGHVSSNFSWSVSGRHSLTCVNGGSAAYVDGMSAEYVANENPWGAGGVVAVGGRVQSGNVYPFRGDVYAIRAYTTALAAQAVAYNRKVDKVRFGLSPRTLEWGGGSDGYFCTNGNWTALGLATRAVPGASDAAVLSAGTYTATIDDECVLDSLAVGVGVTLKLKLPRSKGVTPPPMLSIVNTLDAAATAELELDSELFDKTHYGQSVAIVECGEDSTEALTVLADSLNAKTGRMCAKVVGGTSLVYVAPPPPGMTLIFR